MHRPSADGRWEPPLFALHEIEQAWLPNEFLVPAGEETVPGTVVPVTWRDKQSALVRTFAKENS